MGETTQSARRETVTGYQAITLRNYETVPQIRNLPEHVRWDIRVVGTVLPFKTNRWVVDDLVDWDNAVDDPIFRINFPHRGMLTADDYARMDSLLRRGADQSEIVKAANAIRLTLNPQPAGQLEHNVPTFEGQTLAGMQHKYRETVLFFPSQGQTCHAYCTFCFRWPQFVGIEGLKFAMREAELLAGYVHAHPEISDVLFTGGDPLVMKTSILERYIDPLLAPGQAPNVLSIRIGTKALTYWPQRVVTDPDADDLLRLFERVVESGRNLAFMVHFNHPREQQPPLVREAIRRLRAVGVTIRTQTPLLRHVNDDADVLAQMWAGQVQIGCVPYYLFVARDTGARHYFELPLARCWQIFRKAYSQVSGLARTVRGPSMSATPGKVQVLGVTDHDGQKVFVLRFLQGRSPAWVDRPFFARYDPHAFWMNDLKPVGDEKAFFYQAELEAMLAKPGSPWSRKDVHDD